MKRLFTILLLLVTSCYILPVKDYLKQQDRYCLADMDESKEESAKKEKSKDFLGLTPALFISTLSISYAEAVLPSSVPLLLHTVETPPPDLA